MSSAFLKKSLGLVDSKSKVIIKKEQDNVYSQLKFINKKKKSKHLRGAGDVQRRNIETVEKIRKEHKKRSKKGLNKFKINLLHKPVDKNILNKILEHLQAPGLEVKKEEKKEEKTVFTEEDFAKFEKEYFAD